MVPIASQLNGINYATYGLPAIPNTAHSSWTSKLYGTLGEKQIPNSQYDFEVALAVKNVLNRPVSDAIYVAK